LQGCVIRISGRAIRKSVRLSFLKSGRRILADAETMEKHGSEDGIGKNFAD
jgi:hypothetical protein